MGNPPELSPEVVQAIARDEAVLDATRLVGKSMTKAEIKRKPPAYLMYAADLLASEQYYSMPLPERGLCESMMCVCWVNSCLTTDPDGVVSSVSGSITADPEGIAQAIRRPLPEVVEALKSGRVLAYFAPSPLDASRLVCREVIRQLEEAKHTRQSQVSGGRESAKRNKQRAIVTRGGKHPNNYPADHGGPEKRRAEKRREELIRNDGGSSSSPIGEETL
jgi:hypothetical protein